MISIIRGSAISRNSIILFLLLLLLESAPCKGQICCGMPWPPENLRKDTITTFSFADGRLPLAKIPQVKPTSNYSFKAKYFTMLWLPVKTSNIDDFVEGSIRSYHHYKTTDTLSLNFLGKRHTGIVFQKKARYSSIIFQKDAPYQDVFVVTFRSRKNLSLTTKFIEQYLHW